LNERTGIPGVGSTTMMVGRSELIQGKPVRGKDLEPATVIPLRWETNLVFENDTPISHSHPHLFTVQPYNAAALSDCKCVERCYHRGLVCYLLGISPEYSRLMYDVREEEYAAWHDPGWPD
jgi:hypothetical protein